MELEQFQTQRQGRLTTAFGGCLRFKWGAVRFLQRVENEPLFETVSIWVKGGWKETRGVQRPTSG
jgi:hypothetical protein